MLPGRPRGAMNHRPAKYCIKISCANPRLNMHLHPPAQQIKRPPALATVNELQFESNYRSAGAWAWGVLGADSLQTEQRASCFNSISPTRTDLHQPGKIQQASSTGCCLTRAATCLLPTAPLLPAVETGAISKIGKAMAGDFHLVLPWECLDPQQGSTFP